MASYSFTANREPASKSVTTSKALSYSLISGYKNQRLMIHHQRRECLVPAD